VYQETNRIAYQDYGILTTRINPRDTSRLDPWNNELYRINLHSGEVAIRMIHDGKLEVTIIVVVTLPIFLLLLIVTSFSDKHMH
jgi:hypothetical protein